MGANARSRIRWFDRIMIIVTSVISIATLFGILSNFLSPHTKISAEIVDGSWRKIKSPDLKGCGEFRSIVRCQYEFEMKIRNVGNSTIYMSDDELKLVMLCSNTPLRRWNIPPIIEIKKNESLNPDIVKVESMKNNVLQFRGIRFPLPFLSSARVKIEISSPLADMGGVTLSPIDPIFNVRTHNRTIKADCKIESG